MQSKLNEQRRELEMTTERRVYSINKVLEIHLATFNDFKLELRQEYTAIKEKQNILHQEIEDVKNILLAYLRNLGPSILEDDIRECTPSLGSEPSHVPTSIPSEPLPTTLSDPTFTTPPIISIVIPISLPSPSQIASTSSPLPSLTLPLIVPMPSPFSVFATSVASTSGSSLIDDKKGEKEPEASEREKT